MNVETPPTIACPACKATAHAVLDDQWGKTEGWRCRSCRGYVALDGDRRDFDVTTMAAGVEFDPESISAQVHHVSGIDSSRVVRAEDGRFEVVTESAVATDSTAAASEDERPEGVR